MPITTTAHPLHIELCTMHIIQAMLDSICHKYKQHTQQAFNNQQFKRFLQHENLILYFQQMYKSKKPMKEQKKKKEHKLILLLLAISLINLKHYHINLESALMQSNSKVAAAQVRKAPNPPAVQRFTYDLSISSIQLHIFTSQVYFTFKNEDTEIHFLSES